VQFLYLQAIVSGDVGLSGPDGSADPSLLLQPPLLQVRA
jgi:hypothetical protein